VKQTIGLAAALLLGALSVNVGHAQSGKSGVEKLYILNCGEGVAGDISRWSPGLNEGKPMDFVDNCYLIKHAQGWFLWDTGVTDAVAAMPDGLAPADPKAVLWRRPKTLVAHLDQLGVKAANRRDGLWRLTSRGSGEPLIAGPLEACEQFLEDLSKQLNSE